MMDIATIFYNRDKVSIKIYYYEINSINFTNSTVNKNTFEAVVEAIELPQQICKDFFKKMADSKYEKGFVCQSSIEIKPNYRITFNNKNYNVKDVIALPDDYYLIMTAAMHGEVAN